MENFPLDDPHYVAGIRLFKKRLQGCIMHEVLENHLEAIPVRLLQNYMKVIAQELTGEGYYENWFKDFADLKRHIDE